MTPELIERLAENVVNEIILDISDRHGLGDEWDQTDSGTRREIRKAWRQIVEIKLRGAANDR